MTSPEISEHFLVLRPDFNNPDTSEEGHLVFHTLEDAESGQEIQTFIVDVDDLTELPETEDNVRQYRIIGKMLTGNVVCTVTYDDNNFSQKLAIESVNLVLSKNS